MRTIKVGFSKNCHLKGTIMKLLYDMIQKNGFELKILDDGYDYFFCTETSYWNKENFDELLTQKPETIRIFFCGETIYPDLNLFDYALCFDDFDDSRIMNTLAFNLNRYFYDIGINIDDIKKNINPKDILREKTKFCNFIYSNPLAHPMRDKLFYTLSTYKKVDSLGRHLKNINIKDTSTDKDWRSISIDLKKPYKFSIAAENAYARGYISEKIVTSMAANTIPIYFGSQEVVKYFNPKSFINVNDFATLEDVVKKVKEIDKNDNLYLEMMSEPWRTEKQIELAKKSYEDFLKRFYYIFEQDFDRAHRRPQGCWADYRYPNFFLKSFYDIVPNSSYHNFIEKYIFSVKKTPDKKYKILTFFGNPIIIQNFHRHKSKKARICLLVDRPNWAFDISAKEIVNQLSDEFYFDIKYVVDKPKLNPKNYDLLHIWFWGETYHQKFKFPKNKILKEVSSHRWQDNPMYGPYTPREMIDKYLFDAKNILCTSERLFNLFQNCENKDSVLQNFILREKGFSSTKFYFARKRIGEMKICWAGNIKDHVKGIEEILIPATKDKYVLNLASNLKHEQMRDFYNNSDIYVVCSKNEATPLPLIESMACGCFPVVNDVGIVPEIIRHKENGYIVKERTIVAYQEAFEWCEKNIEFIRMVGKENARWAFDNKRWEIMAQGYREMYRQCL